MATSKKKLSKDEQAQQEELQRQRALEQEKERIRALAEQRGLNERNIMDGLVETDDQPRALEMLARGSHEVGEWYLRCMVVEKLGRQILLNQDYTQEELQEWLTPFALGDANSYVRRAAIKHLSDIPALARAASEDAEPCVRRKAVQRLFFFAENPDALEALNAVALNDPEPELRLIAVQRIIDQNALGAVAKSDVEFAIRQAATNKLTSQEALAWVLLNDPTVQVRTAAAERMTDIKALVQTASAQNQPN